MRLKAIELDQVGTFGRPIKIDGIGPGLNVLAGANELGKSTILRGLTALFTEQHRAGKQSIRSLRPYVGGAPFLACDYEYDEQSWRLEKRFLAAHMALLERIDGSERYQGADAENRLDKMLGEGSALGTSLPLLWVDQGASSFDVPVLTDGARQSLGQLLSAQAENTSGVGAAQAVLRAVDAELGQLVTEKTGKARKNSSYHNLIAEHAQLSSSLEEAQRKASDAEQRLARLTELQHASAELQDPKIQVSLEAQISEHEQRLQRAEEARLKLQQLSDRVAFLDNQKKQREATLADYDEGLQQLHAIGSAMSAADVELVAIAAKNVIVVDQLQTVEADLKARIQRAAALNEEAEQLRRADEQINQHQRLQQLTSQRDRLGAISSEIAGIDLELDGLTWPEDTIVKLRRSGSQIEQGRARQEASAPRVVFSYQPGRDSGFRLDEQDIADGAEVTVSGPLVIEVEGVGRIEVVPSASDGLAAVAQGLTVATAEYDACLALMRAVDAGDAEVREERRVALRQSRQLLLSERNVIAPDGEAQLSDEQTRLRSLGADNQDALVAVPLKANGDTGARLSAAEIAVELCAVQASKVEGAATLETLRGEKSGIDQRRGEIAAELRVRRTRHDELRIKYAQDDGAADQREEHVALVAAAEQELNAAVRERLAVQEVALTETVTLELKQNLVDLRARLKSRGEQLNSVLQETGHVEGMLARDFEDGASDQVGELRDRVEELGERIKECELHIAALRLLSGQLRSETTRRRDAIARPLARRLSSLAARIWPGAEVPLNSDLAVDGLVRSGQQEGTDRVSSGTREQVAVLARLAYAGLLAEGCEPLPVILDDPLVYSDDHRLEALFETMAEAAQAHQVIILTCHKRSFEPLVSRFGATRLTIEEMSELPGA